RPARRGIVIGQVRTRIEVLIRVMVRLLTRVLVGVVVVVGLVDVLFATRGRGGTPLGILLRSLGHDLLVDYVTRSLAELVEALAELLRDFRQALGSEQDQYNEKYDQRFAAGTPKQREEKRNL